METAPRLPHWTLLILAVSLWFYSVVWSLLWWLPLLSSVSSSEETPVFIHPSSTELVIRAVKLNLHCLSLWGALSPCSIPKTTPQMSPSARVVNPSHLVPTEFVTRKLFCRKYWDIAYFLIIYHRSFECQFISCINLSRWLYNWIWSYYSLLLLVNWIFYSFLFILLTDENVVSIRLAMFCRYIFVYILDICHSRIIDAIFSSGDTPDILMQHKSLQIF